MRNVVLTLSLASACLSYAGTGHAQSLAEVAKKEKARRAQISETRTDGDAVAIGERELRNANGSTFTAVEVKGGQNRAATPSAAASAPPVNPNKQTTAPSTKTGQTTSRPSAPTAANTELGKGWSTKNESATGERGWNPRRKEILESMGRRVDPIHPRTVQERDGNRNH